MLGVESIRRTPQSVVTYSNLRNQIPQDWKPFNMLPFGTETANIIKNKAKSPFEKWLLNKFFHNNYGYCKYKEECRKKQVNIIWEDLSCEISKCMARHPKPCKLYSHYGKCKFDPCAFKHVENFTSIESMKKENEKMLEEAIKGLDDKVVDYSGLDEKLLAVEKRLDHFVLMEKEISEKDAAF